MKVTIVLPTYNRARFLAGAIRSILGQTFTDWELVIVDDGSTDGTREVIETMRPEVANPIHYLYQDNAGAGSARNVGLEHASGELIAFFDSDDLWLPGFLEEGVRALDKHPALDWVWCDAIRVDATDGHVLQESQYFADGRRHPILKLKSRTEGDLSIIQDDNFLEHAMIEGFVCFVQASVIRRSVFIKTRFWEDYRVIEDKFLVLRCIVQGVRFGFRSEKDVILQMHDDNVSLVGESLGMKSRDLAKSASICSDEVDAWLRLSREANLSRRDRATSRWLAASCCFWNLGYVTYWSAGDRENALDSFRYALSIWPLAPTFWKTYVLCLIRNIPSYLNFLQNKVFDSVS